jgi:hypothetical protein
VSFNPDDYRLKGGLPLMPRRAGAKAPPPNRKPFKAEFVMFPMSWFEALSRTKNRHAWQLALALLAERHKRKHVGGEVVISSETVPGMHRMARWRATKKLVEFGLIEVDSASDRAAPRVLNFCCTK